MDKVIDGIDVLLTDVDPTWSRKSVAFGFHSPIDFGEGRRIALEVLKDRRRNDLAGDHMCDVSRSGLLSIPIRP